MSFNSLFFLCIKGLLLVHTACQQPPPPACCTVPVFQQVACGMPGITAAQCNARNCCFDIEQFWCYRKATACQPSGSSVDGLQSQGSRLSEWSQWSVCPSKTCVDETRTRARWCVYEDGRQAPSSFCTGELSETAKCSCVGKAGISGPADECKDGSQTCTSFQSLCDSSELFKFELCRITCGQCVPSVPSSASTEKTTVSPPSTTKKTLENCKDHYKSCKHKDISKLCRDEAHTSQMKIFCPATCGFCPDSTNAECKDKYPQTCREQKNMCYTTDTENSKTMQEMCPATCNTCENLEISVDGGVTKPLLTAPSECVDKTTDCAKAINSCSEENAIGEVMRDYCALTCGMCSQTNAFTPARSLISRQTLPPTIPNTVLTTTCKDSIANCSRAISLCYDPGIAGEITRSSCRYTCQSCSSPTVPTVASVASSSNIIPRLPQTPSKLSCKNDLDDDICFRHASSCRDILTNWAVLCRRTCNQCVRPILIESATMPEPKERTAPKTSKVAPPPGCKDHIPLCPKHPNLCKDSKSGWSDACRVTCGTCITEPSVTTLEPTRLSSTPEKNLFKVVSDTTTAAVSNCKNIYLECQQYSYLCNQPSSNWTRDCPVTCGSCPTRGIQSSSTPELPTQAATLSECKDIYPAGCPAQKATCSRSNGTTETTELMRRVCPVTCNSCGEVATPLPSTSTSTNNPESLFAWTNWSQCSVTCGEGESTRTKVCLRQGALSCQRADETRTCKAGVCKVRGAAETGVTCANVLEDKWCNATNRSLPGFCDNEVLASNCRKACGKC